MSIRRVSCLFAPERTLILAIVVSVFFNTHLRRIEWGVAWEHGLLNLVTWIHGLPAGYSLFPKGKVIGIQRPYIHTRMLTWLTCQRQLSRPLISTTKHFDPGSTGTGMKLRRDMTLPEDPTSIKGRYLCWHPRPHALTLASLVVDCPQLGRVLLAERPDHA